MTRFGLHRGGLIPSLWYAQTLVDGPGAWSLRWLHHNTRLQEWKQR